MAVVFNGENVGIAFPLETIDNSMDNTINKVPTLITKEINTNGTYNASDDNADGYKSVIVNVASSGGSGEDMLQARVNSNNSCKYLFYAYGGNNVDYIANLDTSSVTDMEGMFQSSLVKSIPLLNTRSVTTMSHMFNSCQTIKTIPQLDTSSCTTMYNMFKGCRAFTTMPQLNTSNVISMYGMFEDCSNLTTIPLLNTSKVTTMYNMFKGCTKLASIPQLDTSSCTNMQYMFYNCNGALTEIPQLNTSNVTNMGYMLAYCNKFKTLPELDTRKVTNMSNMFRSNWVLETIPLLDMRSITSNSQVTDIFNDCKALTNLTLKNVKQTLQISSSMWGLSLTLDSLINTIKELWDYSSGSTTYKLTMGVLNLNRIANTYVKLIDVTDEMIAQDDLIASKKPCVVCESTDEGAMTITEYALLKKWSLA